MKKKFNVCYWFHLSDTIEIEAENEKEAEDIVDDMIYSGELGNLNEMEIGDSGIETYEY